MIDNVSSYLTYTHSGIWEWQFLAAIATLSDCGIPPDANNICGSAGNHEFDPQDQLEAMPKEQIGQIRMADHRNKDHCLLDTQEGPVIDPIWLLYHSALRHFRHFSTLTEWEDNGPAFDELCARRIYTDT